MKSNPLPAADLPFVSFHLCLGLPYLNLQLMRMPRAAVAITCVRIQQRSVSKPNNITEEFIVLINCVT